MADVGRPDPPTGGDGSGGDEAVVRPYVLAASTPAIRRGQLGPEPGMGTGTEQRKGEWGERSQDGLDECLPSWAMLRRRPVDTV